MGFIDMAIEKNKYIWDKSLESSFICHLKDGILLDEKFDKYVEQDKYYLLNFVKLCGKAISNSNSCEEMDIYISLINISSDLEFQTRQSIKPNGQETKIYKETKDYSDFLLKFINDEDNTRIFIVLLTCMLIYDYIFTNIAKKMEKTNKYYFFVKDYLSNDYKKSCKKWLEFARKYYLDVDKTKENELIEIMKESSQLDYNFWQMCFND